MVLNNQDLSYSEFMDTINAIRERSKSDREFRSKCINNPLSAIEQTAGRPYQGFNVIFTEDLKEHKLHIDSPKARTLTFLLPDPD